MNTYHEHPHKRESFYYGELDESTGLHCVFGADSGFAYSSWASQVDADREAEKLNKQ